MSTTVGYDSEKELDAGLDQIIRNNPDLIPLIDAEVRVAGCFVTRTDKDDQTLPPKGAPVALKKVSPEMQIFMSGKTKPSFVLVVDRYWWDHTNEGAREQMVGRFLSLVSVDKSTDGVKVKKEKFDIQESSKALKRYGTRDAQSAQLRDIMISMSASAEKKMRSKPDPEPDPDPDANTKEPDPDPPRVVAHPLPLKKPAEDAPRRGRRVPPDPPATSAPPPDPEDE